MTVVTAAMALSAGRLVPRFGEWPVVAAGLTSGAVGATHTFQHRAFGRHLIAANSAGVRCVIVRLVEQRRR